MDWHDLTIPHETHAYMVSQNNPDLTLGELQGIDWGSSSVSADFENDNRTSGKLSVVDTNWIRGSFIRIYAEYPDVQIPLGTYVVADDPAERKDGAWSGDLELQSMIWTLEQNKDVQQWTVAQGAMALDAVKQMLDFCKRQYRVDGPDAAVGSHVLYESGTTFRERLYDLCSISGNRLDVDGMGVITIKRDVPAAQITPSFEFDLESPDGIAADGIQRSTDFLSSPGRVAVAYRWSDSNEGESVQHEVVGWVDADGYASEAQRGYMVTDFRVVSELDPPTQQAAQEEARKAMDELGGEHVEWKLTTMFVPIWEGDAVTLVVPDGEERYRGRRHCLVKSVDIELRHLTMQLTLVEV